jgi:hypothetical protein
VSFLFYELSVPARFTSVATDVITIVSTKICDLMWEVRQVEAKETTAFEAIKAQKRVRFPTTETDIRACLAYAADREGKLEISNA